MSLKYEPASEPLHISVERAEGLEQCARDAESILEIGFGWENLD